MNIQKMPKLKKKEVQEKIIFKVEARVFFLIFFLVVFFLGQYFLKKKIIVINPAAEQPAEQAAAIETSGQPVDKISLPAGSTPTQRDLFLGSFGYTVSNIDETKTSLYFDKTSTAIFFLPDYEWKDGAIEAGDSGDSLNAIKFNSFNGPYEDERCLGKNCLEQKGNNLYYNGRSFAHPAGVRNLDIAAVSIGALQDRWLVGYTIKTKDGYEGQVFYFNGWKFTKIALPEPIASTYFGLLGFGGEEKDFLVIYGAYQGLAYRVRDDKAISLDKFFGLRVMDKGFKPEAIKVTVGSNINWYIYSRTAGHPQFIKLWQNGGQEIVGEEAFPNLFIGYETAALALQSASSDEIVLKMELTDKKGNRFAKMFTDRGFKNSQEGILTTLPITHDGNKSEIVIKKIVRSRLDIDWASRLSARFLFSPDGVKWQNIPLGENLDFVTPKLSAYFLRVILSPSDNKFYSPFVSGISFDYYCQK
jgi:hypothetical protein